jgi:environmental stress-induced protein Ves
MEIQLIKASELQVSDWAGGKTTQLYIYPASADFAEKDFDYRISTATVELEDSSFTPFPNYNRKLMILDGVLDLFHDDQYAIQLHPFDQDAFSGDWISHSKGKVIDYNVIFSLNYSSEIFHFELSKGEEVKLNCKDTTLLYVLYGEIAVSKGSAQQKDVIIIEGQGELVINATSDALIVVTEVNKIEE